MTRAQLVQEVVDRGYDYVSTSRIQSYIQRSYRTICARYPFPFLETTSEGTAPREISDLRKVLSVTDATNDSELRGVERQWLVSAYPDLPDEGRAEYWYLEDDTFKVYPADTTSTFKVRYIKRPAELGESDSPLIPEEWQYLIVDLAVTHCLRDDDEYDEARMLREDVEVGIREMANDLMHRNYQGPKFIRRTGSVFDYL